jgi:hypothetical protein
MKKILILFIFTSVLNSFFAQHQEVVEKPSMWKGKNHHVSDTTSFLHAFKNGTTHGHFRYYASHTFNEGSLSDYYANAIGGGIRYETAQYHRFQFAVSGFYFFNIGSSDMTYKDPTTGQVNRYEIGLFDIEDPHNKKDMDRLEELYLKYNLKKGHLIFGRQIINTPLLNLQDGRMRATGVEGLYIDYQFSKKLEVEGGWIYAISPRSSTRWFYGAESIGLYPVGVNELGTKSNYAGNLKSLGIGIAAIRYNPIKGLKLQAWNYYMENMMNSVFLQADYQKQLKNEKQKLTFGAQMIRQDALNFGGNEDQSKTYMLKNSKAMTFGGKVGLIHHNSEFSFNYNRITKHGRFLFPREWGRDPFYTFMPRERNEGFGDVHAITAKFEQKFPKKRVKTSFAAGYFRLPDVHNFALNKYGIPSYYQVNADIRYAFSKN